MHYLQAGEGWDEFINDDNLYEKAEHIISSQDPVDHGPDLIVKNLNAPIESQEIWASGFTYYNSKPGREEESKEAGGSNFYARVYAADRPEFGF